MDLERARERLVFPLDYPSLAEARSGAEQVHESAGVLKIGLELFVREGGSAVRMARDLGAQVFLDLKLHDISETVERAVASACQLGARYLTVHASGGSKMLERAVARAARENTGLVLLAVTVLTSLDEADLRETGIEAKVPEQVARLAKLATGSGIPGLVCSPMEVQELRRLLGSDVVLVTPGIRPSGPSAQGDDQKRVATPEAAIRAGSSLLVVGRPIRDAADPGLAARGVVQEIAKALSAA